MTVLDQKIEECRSELEALYLRLRSGDDCMAQVLAVSKRLDDLLMGHAMRKKTLKSGSQ
jgi:hypothetical protein